MTNDRLAHTVENAVGGIILTAQAFNPSIFSETWLAKNEILSSEAFEGGRVCSPEVAQFQTSAVAVMVIPPKMQITFGLEDHEPEASQPLHIAARTIELLPHTPFTALGINFDFFVSPPEHCDFNSFNRALFGDGDSELLREFDSPDARFGRYFSKDHEAARLKLNIKPVRAGTDAKDILLFSFNFHHDVTQLDPPEKAPHLLNALGQWASFREYAGQLLGISLKGQIDVER